jgi:hypothetical protein
MRLFTVSRQHSRFLYLLVAVSLLLGMAGPAQVLAAPQGLTPDLVPQATTVTVDGTPTVQTSTTGTTVSWSHTTGTGTNRLMLVGVSWNSATTATTISSVTFTPSGGSATALSPVITRQNSWAYRYTAIYSLVNPPSGTSGTVAVTLSTSVTNGVVAGAANFAGVDQTTPLGPAKGADGVSASSSVTLSGLVGDELVFDNVLVGGNSTGAAADSSQTQLTGWNSLASTARGAASTKPATTSTTMIWTPAGTQTSWVWADVAVPILPVCTGTRYTLTASVGSNGTAVTLNPPGGSYCSGRTVTLTPVPSSGYLFSSWSGTNAGNVVNTGGVYTIVMNGNKSVTANFASPTCQDVSLTVDDDTYLSGGATTTNYGNATTLQVDGSGTAATQRSALLRWNLSSVPANASVTSASIALNVTDSSTIAYPLYDVAKQWVEGTGAAGSGATWATYDGSIAWGTAGASTTTGNIDRGTLNLWSSTTTSFSATGVSTVSLTADGLAVVRRWVAGGSNNGVMIQQYSGSSNTLYFNSAEGTTPPKLNLNYCTGAPPTYNLTADNDGNGTVTLNPIGGVYASGTTVTLTPVPSSGYKFSSWSGTNAADIINTSGVYTIVMNGNKTVQANFTSIGTTFTGTELLGQPEATSISVSVVPDEAISLYYEYGTTSGGPYSSTSTVTATAGQPKVVTIGGLTANAKYYYRMQYSKDGGATWVTRPELSFQTQRATGSTFTFDITSDSHIGIQLGTPANWTSTLNGVVADHPDFLLDLGDTIAMDDGSASVGLGDTAETESRYTDALPYFNMVSGKSPIYIVPGNHEQQEAWHLTASNTGGDPAVSLPVMGKNAEKKYFLNPVNDAFYSGDTSTYSYLSGDHLKQDYYAWTWGDALFVVISPFWTTTTKPYTTSAGGGEGDTTGSNNRWDWTLGSTQFNWLKTTLQNSSAKYKFVFAHQIVGGNSASGMENYGHGGAATANLVEWGGYDVGGSNYTWATNRPTADGWGSQPIHQMMVANGVSAFFHGHDHQYAYEKLDGMVYQSMPSGSFTGSFATYTTGGNTIWADSTQGPGHLKVTVGPSQTTVEFIRYNASTSANTYTINANVNAAVTISKSSARPKLDWSAASVDHYGVYRSTTAPYFALGPGARLGPVTSAAHTYTDSTANLGVAPNAWYYVVAPEDSSNTPIGTSNRTGAFVFGLTPGN